MLPFLAAMWAAGAVSDYIGTRNSIDTAKQGQALQYNEIQKQIQLARLASTEASLSGMIQLRQNLGSQAAIFAARGQRQGQGTTALFPNTSIGNFNADERVRKINDMVTESQLRTNQKISKLHTEGYESQQIGGFAKRTINTLPSSSQAWAQFLGRT